MTTYSPRRDSEEKTQALSELALVAVRALPGASRRQVAEMISNHPDYRREVHGVIGAQGMGNTNIGRALALLEKRGLVKIQTGPGGTLQHVPLDVSPRDLHRKEAERLAECAQQWGEASANNDGDERMAQIGRDATQLALVHALLATLPDPKGEGMTNDC